MCVAIFALLMGLGDVSVAAQRTDAKTGPSGDFRSVIRAAFAHTHDGFSSDELLLQDALRDSFLRDVRMRLAERSRIASAPDKAEPWPTDEPSLLRGLLQLRKSGQLTVPASRRGRTVSTVIKPVAEIAVRVVMDRHQVSSDTILIDPKLRSELQREALKVLPSADAYEVRKAVLQLRKQRSLRPELVLRVANWRRDVQTVPLVDLEKQFLAGAVPDQPGVYLFRHHRDGYLYVGEAVNLKKRLAQHVQASDRKSLADFLSGNERESVSVEMHIFDKDSPGAQLAVRRAYESELIRSRNPRFNVRP